MADMIVSGAGTTTVNGTYVESGTVNGKPYYAKESFTIKWAASQWQIKSFLLWYFSNNDVATPDLCTTWNSFEGFDPVPTVTASGGGSTGNPYYYYAQLR